MTGPKIIACCLLSILTIGQQPSTDRQANPAGSENAITVTDEEMAQHSELLALLKRPNPLKAKWPNDD